MLTDIRPANMRTTHGLMAWPGSLFELSVSAAMCVEECLSDPMQARESGSGMDAPEELPLGSVKAFFNESLYGAKSCFGVCQRTVRRG